MVRGLSLWVLSMLFTNWAWLKAMDTIQYDPIVDRMHRSIADDMAQNMIGRFNDEFVRESADNTLVYAKRQSDSRAQDTILFILNSCITSNSSNWFTNLQDDSLRKTLHLVVYKLNKKTSAPEQKDLAEYYSTVLNKLTQNWAPLDTKNQENIPLDVGHTYAACFVKYNPEDYEKILLESIALYQGWSVECGDTFYDPIRQTTYTLHSSDDKPCRIYLAVTQKNTKAVKEFLKIVPK